MPSIILDDFFGDTKIELQLAHKASVDDKNLEMIHRVFGEIKKLKKENKKLKEGSTAVAALLRGETMRKDPIKDCMNDIINQVESREWRRVNEHRDRMMKKWKKEKAKVEEMKDDWEVATEKIGQENSDLHNQIKRLKGELKAYKSDARNQGQININREKEIKRLQEHYDKTMSEEHGWANHLFAKQFEAQSIENEKLKDEADEEIERLKQELKAVKDANVMFMMRYEKKVEEEKKIDEICSRIKCEDNIGHLIGRIPTDK